MVRVGIFGSRGELDRQVVQMLIDELLEQCCERVGSEEVKCVASHASGQGIGEFVFEEGDTRGVKTVGMVLPSCRAEQWFPVDDVAYVGDEWGEHAIEDCNDVVDVIVWVGDVEPKRDWLELANLSNVRMLTVSDSMMDWSSPASVIDLDNVVGQLLDYQHPRPIQ